MLDQISQLLAQSTLREWALYALFEVPGLPPILQSIHILSISVLLAAVAIAQLRVLGVSFTGRPPAVFFRRFVSVGLSALLLAFLSGVIFVLARPDRYVFNPVAAIKAVAMMLALLFAGALYLHHSLRGQSVLLARLLAACGLLAWLTTLLAGRWIAYADYLFWE